MASKLITLTLRWGASKVTLNTDHIIKIEGSLSGGTVVTTVETNPNGSNKFYIVDESPVRIKALRGSS